MRTLRAAGLLLLLVLPPRAWGVEFTIFPVDRGLYRGSPPRTRADFEQLRRLGIRTILDMQSFWPDVTDWEQRMAAEYGIAYWNYPVSPLPGATEEIEEAFRLMLRRQAYPIFVHCQQDRDRTSVVCALYRVRCQGWSPRAAYNEMLWFGLRPILLFYHIYFWENAYAPGWPAKK